MKNSTILLVEDNEHDEQLTLAAFKENNFNNTIVTVRNGEEALDYLFCTGPYQDRDHDPPQLVLLDLKLPKVDGFEVLKSIRSDERTRLIPVVILSSSKEQQDRTSGYTLGCNAYIRKPVDFVQFSETIRTLGLFWTVLNESPYDP